MFGYEKPAPPDAKTVPVQYRFRKPAKLRVLRPDGLTVLEGFGVGETITIMEPDVQLLISAYTKLASIPMPDGASVVEWPEDLDMERVG